MSEVKRFDEYTCGVTEAEDGEYVKHSDYAKLAAEAQALREERDSQQRVAINAMEELAALRARVLVVPERKLLNAGVPGLNRNSGWNACLDELVRLNGKTVSEGLLRRLARPADRYDEVFTLDRHEAAEEIRALLSEQEGGKQ
ncbi:hypothetical protein KZ879_32700 [Pseudomonas aeruginosa]|uniref:hypothetical protein n=1 Tax=Pseudomonas aeruginosa TaxID=287 RepID=UPI001CA4E332|nr:hypothetical protein [Pseudomonas aeruginosa]MBW6319228.1 hypothetical protein [Pseudomonas aeruginosa]